MSGSKPAGKRTASTNKQKYGEDYYSRIGAMGGKSPKTKPSGFAADPERARAAGRAGGLARTEAKRLAAERAQRERRASQQ